MKAYLYRLWQWIYKGIPTLRVPANVVVSDAAAKLNGRKIIITGGSSGIGYHIAKAFVEQGAEVVIVGRNMQKLTEASIELGCKFLQYDLCDIAHLDTVIAQSAALLGGLDGLVNNAGICNIDNGFLNVTEQSYDEQFLLNVKSPFFLTQAFLRYIESQHVASSSVLFITSERGLYPDDAPYGMTKAALGNIVAGLARRFAVKGVHVNAIAPGVVADVINDKEKYNDLYLKGAVGKRFILPQEIAQTALWLMSDESRCVSGEIIPCNQANHLK